jgi:hypothetical protein
MSFFCVKSVRRKAVPSDRKNARLSDKEYSYVYEAHAIRDKRSQKVRHKLIGRIGHFFRLEKKDSVLIDSEEAGVMDKDSFLRHVLKLNLIAHGMTESEKLVFENDTFAVNLYDFSVRKKNICSDVVLGINDGYLCSRTLKSLFDFELVAEADMPLLVRCVRDIGLLPTAISEKKKPESVASVEGLIALIGRALGDEFPNYDKVEILDKHRAFLSILVSKYPKFRPTRITTEEVPIDKFREEIGW